MDPTVIAPLLRSGWQGDAAAWRALCHRDVAALLQKVCRARQSAAHSAEELAQAVLTRLIQRAMNRGGLAVEGEVSSPEGLLRRTFDNLIQDELRRHRRHENKHDPLDEDLDADERSGRPLVSEGPAPDAPLDQRRAFSAAVQHALDLKPNYRIGVLMVHLPEQIVPPHLHEMGPRDLYPNADVAWARLHAARPLDDDDLERRAQGTFILWGGDHPDLITFRTTDSELFETKRGLLQKWCKRGEESLKESLSAAATSPRLSGEPPTAERP